MLNLWTSSVARRTCAQVEVVRQRVPYTPVFFPVVPSSRYCSTTPAVSVDLANVPPPLPTPPQTSPPHVAHSKAHKIVEKVKEEFHRFVNGSKLLGKNTKTAAYLLHGMANGQTLNRRERQLMVTTVADLIRMVPFVVILIVPFAEFALPVLLKVFPNMLPSTFTSDSQKEASRARKLQAKLKVIEVLQAASENLVLRGKLDSNDAHESLVSFMTKISRGEEIQLQEVLKISQIFNKEFSLDSLDKSQLVSLAKFFGIPSLGNAFILQESLKFKWNLLSKDDGHIMRDGLESLSPAELQEAAVSRGFSHSNPYQDQKQYVQEWITLSKQNVPPYLLLLSRAQYFTKNIKKVIDITPPVIIPFIPQLSAQMNVAPATKVTPKRIIYDLPEKELVPLEFKNLSHELSYNPVISKLWDRIARFTSDIKKETFGGREAEVIHLGDASADALSTVITAELRRYLQAIFIALDKDGDRRLSVGEVEHGLYASDIPIRHEEAVSLVQLHDSNGGQLFKHNKYKMLLGRSLRVPLGAKIVRHYSTAAGRVLVVADHNNSALQPSSLNAISAAAKLGNVEVLVAGKQCDAVAKKVASLEGVAKVLHAENDQLEHPLAEVHASLILNMQKTANYSHIIAPASSFGKNLLPRIAGSLNVSALSDITKIIDADTFVRPIYAGNALAKVKSNEKTKIITVRATAFEKAKEGSNSAQIEKVDAALEQDPKSKWESSDVRESTRPDLSSSRVVVSGGRGMKNGENFKMLEELADVLGGAVGASRAAVDAGFVPNELQVGQTGKIVAPELYIAAGISGAIQHLAGMKDSKLIVCINKDAEAPFFQVADVGLVADLFTAVPELTKALKNEKK